MLQPEIIITEDGSHTLYIPELKEHYHSTFGAIAESMHVFIEAGLLQALKNDTEEINILEVGFGTGLNALLTVLEAGLKGCSVKYTALETFPLPQQLWGKLNYPEQIGDIKAKEIFQFLHQCNWDIEKEIIPGFFITKVERSLQDFKVAGMLYNLIYFDAFGPDVQAELWTDEIFRKISGMTAKGGILVTYSCKGSVRRALMAAGFAVEKIPGPKGKREMLRGVRC
ncbi:MAG: tRNA (5-methylaminomethyl-2-thiouridine)(34)-methyltransferase MnmD [Bacteroidales bacterium]|nr:tRNA (5-methylaminomethyl-2-thiouridine)(34)-methyltransferase MnmD [Bacteroidales bacterium]